MSEEKQNFRIENEMPPEQAARSETRKPSKKSPASVSVNFSGDSENISKKIIVPIISKRNRKKDSEEKQAGGRRNYALASGAGAIFAIIVFHFVFQFSFIQSENFKTLQNPAPVDLSESRPPFAENTFVPEIKREDSAENLNPSENSKKSGSIAAGKTVTEAKVSESNSKKNSVRRKKISPPAPPVRSASKKTSAASAAAGKSRKGKQAPAETRAERLRRAERILTGV